LINTGPRSAVCNETWSEERLSPQSFDMRQAPDANGFFVGDYGGLSALGTTFYPFLSQSDNAGTNVFAATLQAPFPAANYRPSTTEGNVPASAFPVVKGKPIPR